MTVNTSGLSEAEQVRALALEHAVALATQGDTPGTVIGTAKQIETYLTAGTVPE